MNHLRNYIQKDPAGFISKAVPLTIGLTTIGIVGYYYKTLGNENQYNKKDAYNFENGMPRHWITEEVKVTMKDTNNKF